MSWAIDADFYPANQIGFWVDSFYTIDYPDTWLDLFYPEKFPDVWDEETSFYFQEENDWGLPLDENLAHLKETANPQEFVVNPEGVELSPENVQAGKDSWTVEEPPED